MSPLERIAVATVLAALACVWLVLAGSIAYMAFTENMILLGLLPLPVAGIAIAVGLWEAAKE